MAIHELYMGGPAQTNADRAMYPRKTFNAADWADIGVSAHKPYGVVVLNRTIDVTDYALAKYLRDHPAANADVLNIDVIPEASLLLGAHLWIEKAAADATLLLKAGTVQFGTAVSTVGKRFAAPAAAAWQTAEGVTDLGTAVYMPAAKPVSLTLGQTTALNLAGLRVHVSMLLAELIPNNRSTANV